MNFQIPDPVDDSDPAWDYRLIVDNEGESRGIVRRRKSPDGPYDQVLLADGNWHETGILLLNDLNMYERELRPVSRAAALAYLAHRHDTAS